MSTRWDGRLPEVVVARRIRPADSWLGPIVFCLICWAVLLVAAGWLLGWSW